MSDYIKIPESAGKQEKYEAIIPQLQALVLTEVDPIANVANIVAALKYGFDFFWVGFYRVEQKLNTKELVLGPFQGPVACTRIAFGKGVCGKSWETGRTIIVQDVDEFPGHIACSSHSLSEIVVPVIRNSSVIGVLDVDSDKLSNFDEIDQKYLEIICEILEQVL